MDEAQTCSDFCQSAHTAMLSTKGPYKGKGKGKGHKGRYPVRPSNLSIEDRRRKLQELKSKTECKDCGKKGHWKGDRQCTMTKTAHIATNHINAASDASSSATAATTDLVRSSGKGEYRQPVHNSGRRAARMSGLFSQNHDGFIAGKEDDSSDNDEPPALVDCPIAAEALAESSSDEDVQNQVSNFDPQQRSVICKNLGSSSTPWTQTDACLPIVHD